MLATAQQLVAEKTVDKRLSWTRALGLDCLPLDVFRHYRETLRPDFAPFSANYTGKRQNAYSRYMDPGPFEIKT